MKSLRRFCAVLLALCLLFPVAALADNGSIISLGADITETQKQDILAYLSPKEGEVTRIITITNQDERDLLGNYISAAQIGTRSISCSSVTLLENGKGISVQTNNITWVTADMYKNALITAGINDAAVVVTAPFPVSGTAALAGIYKAYESAAGKELVAEAKSAAGEELAITGQLGDLLGQEEAAQLLAQLKEEVVKQGLDKPETIKPAIEQAATELGVTLSSEQIDMLTNLLLRLLELDLDPTKLAEQVNSIMGTLQNLQKAADTTNNFLGGMKSGWDNFVGWIKGLFGGKK